MTPQEETLQAIASIAADPQMGDTFAVKVSYRALPTGIPSMFCTLAGVTAEHILSPEPWLQRLSSDARGFFDLSVAHESAKSKPIGVPIRIGFAHGRQQEPKFDWTALDSPDYRGPTQVVYPTRILPPSEAPKTATPAPPPLQVQSLPSSGPSAQGGMDMALFLQMMREDAKAREVAAERQRQEVERREAREKEERERRDAREREERRAAEEKERQREERRERMEREERERAEKRNQDFLQLLMQTMKPQEDPVKQALLAKALEGRDAAGERMASIIAQMGTFMSQQMGMTLQLIHAQAELAPQQESPFFSLARTAIEGYFGSIAAGGGDMQKALEDVVAPAALPMGQQQAAPAPAQKAEEDEAPEGPGSEEDIEAPMARFDRLIKAEVPLAEVVDTFCAAVVTPEFNLALEAAGGNPQKLVVDRYGEWLKSGDVEESKRKAVADRRVKYLSTVLPACFRVALKRGAIGPPAKQQQAPQSPQPAPEKPRRRKADASPEAQQAEAEPVEAQT